MSRRVTWTAIAVVVFSVFAINILPAATMNYGDFVGTSVTYNNVTEANSGPDLLFSAPSVVADTLEFDPVNFLSEVDPGPGADITDSEINTVVTANPGFFIDNIQISESGDFTLVGEPDAFGEAEVGAAFFFEVLAVDGVDVGDGPIGSVNMQFTTGGGPNGGEYALPGDSGTAVAWTGTAFLNVAAAMDADPNYAGSRATKLRLSFDNTLSTAAGEGASAFIKKKSIGGIIIRTNIPEPSTVILLGCLAAGGAGMVAMRRRWG